MIFTVLATSNPDVQEARLLQDELNRFMRINKMPRDLSWRLREYCYQTVHLQRARERLKVLAVPAPHTTPLLLVLASSFARSLAPPPRTGLLRACVCCARRAAFGRCST